MQVGRGADDNGVDVVRGGDRVQIADLGAVLFRHRGSGSFHRIKHGGENGLVIAVDGTGMNLANTAGTKNGETDGHGGTLRKALSN